jgi:hypothetical protein
MRRILYLLRQLGFDPLKSLAALNGITWYFPDLIRFKRNAKGTAVKLQPVFDDKKSASGSADGHYFWQDMICARWIFEDSPPSHLDVGSRIDGFIAHLLTFMSVQQIDVRKNPLQIDRLTTVIADLTQDFRESDTKFSSVSSLHSLEHFGLGRYGDTINPRGHELGLTNLASYVSPGGFLYVSYPVGEDVVEFNSQRLLPADWAIKHLTGFSLIQYVNIPWRGKPVFGIGQPNNEEFRIGSAILLKLKKL